MKRLNVFSFILFGILATKSFAQSDTIKPLTVGDAVPELSVGNVINNNGDSILNLADNNKQIIILDFFDTYCSTCIEAMPKLDVLQKAMGDKIKIYLVTYQPKETMVNFFKNSEYLKKHGVSLPCIVGDTLLRQYFPHKIISHTAWLYKGTVQGITHSGYVTGDALNTLLAGKSLNLPIKEDDVKFDPKQRIFDVSAPSSFNNEHLSYSAITGFRANINDKSGTKYAEYEPEHDRFRSYFYNQSIFDACKVLLFKIMGGKPNFILTPGRIAMNVNDENRYRYNLNLKNNDGWKREHAISYERIDYIKRDDQQQAKIMLADICDAFNIEAKWEKRPVNCWVISKLDGFRKGNVDLSKKKGMRVEGADVLAFALDLGQQYHMVQQYPPAIDESGFREYMVIGEYENIDELNTQLADYGLVIKEAVREIDVVVINEL